MKRQLRFFFPKRVSPRDANQAGAKVPRWARVYDTLIAARYVRSLDEFARLTERQVRLFFDQAELRRRRDRADRIADVNIAFAGGKEGSDAYRSLLKED